MTRTDAHCGGPGTRTVACRLNPEHFPPRDRNAQAASLGIHPATLYRWLSTKGVFVDGITQQRVADHLGLPPWAVWIECPDAPSGKIRRRAAAQKAAHGRWGKQGSDPDGQARTGQAGLMAKFVTEVRSEPGGAELVESEVTRLATSRYKAHMADLRLRAAKKQSAA